MKYFLLFSFLIFLNYTKASATITTNYADSIIDKSSYKQSKQFFLDNYAKDDTSKALVNYFFMHRKNAFYETVVPPVVAGVSALLLARYLKLQETARATPDDYGGLVIAAPLAFAIFTSGVFLVDGQIRWLRFSRKRLLNLLKDYNSGVPLSRSVKRNIKIELYNLKHPSPSCFICFVK